MTPRKSQCILFSVNQGAKLSVEGCYIGIRAFVLVKFGKMPLKKHEEKGKDSDQTVTDVLKGSDVSMKELAEKVNLMMQQMNEQRKISVEN